MSSATVRQRDRPSPEEELNINRLQPNEVKECQRLLSDVMAILRDYADSLDEHFNNVHIGKAVGGGAGFLGGVLALAGFVCSFFTLGAAAPLIGVGAVVAGLGGATAAGSDIVGTVINKTKLSDAERKWAVVMRNPVLQHYRKKWDVNDPEFDGVIKALFQGFKTGVQMGGLAVKTAARALMVAGAAMEAAFLPISLYDLIKSSIELHKKTKSPAGKKLREMADFLEKVYDKIEREQ